MADGKGREGGFLGFLLGTVRKEIRRGAVAGASGLVNMIPGLSQLYRDYPGFASWMSRIGSGALDFFADPKSPLGEILKDVAEQIVSEPDEVFGGKKSGGTEGAHPFVVINGIIFSVEDDAFNDKIASFVDWLQGLTLEQQQSMAAIVRQYRKQKGAIKQLLNQTAVVWSKLVPPSTAAGQTLEEKHRQAEGLLREAEEIEAEVKLNAQRADGLRQSDSPLAADIDELIADMRRDASGKRSEARKLDPGVVAAAWTRNRLNPITEAFRNANEGFRQRGGAARRPSLWQRSWSWVCSHWQSRSLFRP